MPHNLNGTAEAKSVRSLLRRALLIALFALPFTAIAEPEPATAQLLNIPGDVFRGVFGGYGYHHYGHYHHTRGPRYTHYERTQPTHHRHASIARGSHGGGHVGGGNASSGPGGGNFH